ncbi:MAG: hypothetical protein AAF198_02530 [Pseudomonadota bacterium]
MIAAFLVPFTVAPIIGLPSCERDIGDYASEANHMVIGQDRVAYTSSWAGDGVKEDLIVVHCPTGEGISVRTLEIAFSDRNPFDYRFAVWDELAKIEGSGFLLTLDQMAERFGAIDAETHRVFMKETCACQAMEAEK